MKKYGVVFILAIGFLNARMTEDLKRAVSSAKPDEFIKVNLVMEKQLNAKKLVAENKALLKNREARREFVITKLKEFASQTQAPILNTLKNLENEGEVRNIRSLWIANVISFEAKPSAIIEVQNLPGIRSLDLDEERNLLVGIKNNHKHGFASPDKTSTLYGSRTIEWNIPHIRAPQVWALGYTGQGAIVAVLDTGVRYTHYDLADHIWTNPGEIPNNGVDEDGNGYTDDYYGYDFANNDSDPMDGHGHGTHCAGTVAGDGTAGDTTGVAPDAAIMSVKVLTDAGGGTEAGVWQGMQYAVDNGAHIISMSLGWQHAWNPDRATWRNTCDNVTAAGVHMSVAAGNERSGGSPAPDNIRTPGDVPPPWIHPDQDPIGSTSAVVTIGATDSNDNIASFSSYGPVTWESVAPFNDWPYQPEMGLMDPDVCAPGVNITSLSNGSDTGYASGWSGTSMATPHVAGLMALMLSKNPQLTPREVDSIIETTAIDLGPGGKDNDYGSGRIDCLDAVNATPEAGAPAVPTVVSPFNFAKLPVRNPVFKLATTDPQNDDVIYRIYWATDTLFTSPDSATTPAYPSGSIAQYTLPVSLTQGQTYWFRVKARDTTSAGYWTQYTERFSTTIDTTMLSNTCSWFQTKGAQFTYNQFNGTQIQGDSIVLQSVGYVQDTLLFENFESGLPANWQVVDGNNDGYMWQVGTTTDIGSYAPPNYGTAYAYYSDGDAGSGVVNTYEAIISPAIYIPSSAANLSVEYGYGFRVFQTGETYEAQVRFFTGGSWGSWISLATYTSSGNGTETFDLSSYLPADSVQFQWYYHDENASSNWGWATALDNVLVSYSYTFQNNEGTMTTAPANYNDLSITYPRTNWGYVYWEKATAQDSVGIQVEYYDGASWQLVPDADLPGNSQGFFTAGKIGQVSIINLDTLTYNTLRIKALLYRITERNPDDPSLLSVEIGNPAVEVSEKPALPLRPLFTVSPTIFKDKVIVKYSIPPYTRAKIKIYNATGRIIREVSYTSGNSLLSGSFTWDGTDRNGVRAGTGIYFIKLETKDFKKTIKTIYMK